MKYFLLKINDGDYTWYVEFTRILDSEDYKELIRLKDNLLENSDNSKDITIDDLVKYWNNGGFECKQIDLVEINF